MFHSDTYGKVTLEQIPEKINDYFEKMKHYDVPLQVIIGTDSQNFSYTKMVSVIAVICEGHGGIYFYEISNIDRIKDVRVKLTKETEQSLELISKLTELFENEKYSALKENILMEIHVDAGYSDKGKTKELIPMLVGWIKACGYDCKVKPESYTASSIADRISK